MEQVKAHDWIGPAERVAHKLHALPFQRFRGASRVMESVYKLSSTERVQLLEKDLAVKLSELKAELEELGLRPGITNWTFR